MFPLMLFRPEMAGIKRAVSAALDIGTSYTGYAYSFKEDPEKIYMNDKWRAGNFSSFKTPTCLLMNPARQFKAFGYEAIEKYTHLSKINRHQGWLLFRNFKMEINKQVR